MGLPPGPLQHILDVAHLKDLLRTDAVVDREAQLADHQGNTGHKSLHRAPPERALGEQEARQSGVKGAPLAPFFVIPYDSLHRTKKKGGPCNVVVGRDPAHGELRGQASRWVRTYRGEHVPSICLGEGVYLGKVAPIAH